MADLDVGPLVRDLLNGDRRSLARAITLVESQRPDHRDAAARLLKSIMPHTGASFRVGISGIPGVGKSTFIETFGNYVIDQNHHLAVLAVDPSSPVSGGAILADKTRMQILARRENAFIRPSAAGGNLGGVTRRTRETLLLCEAAGFDLILVETVGIGQSETAVADMTDMFVLLLLPGSGDDLQGIKRGVTELADLVLINKADGDLARAARQTAANYLGALKFLQPRTADWSVPVETCSAIENRGIAEVWATIERYRKLVEGNGSLQARRAGQTRSWFRDEVSASLMQKLKHDPALGRRLDDLERRVVDNRLPPTVAAMELVDMIFGRVES